MKPDCKVVPADERSALPAGVQAQTFFDCFRTATSTSIHPLIL